MLISQDNRVNRPTRIRQIGPTNQVNLADQINLAKQANRIRSTSQSIQPSPVLPLVPALRQRRLRVLCIRRLFLGSMRRRHPACENSSAQGGSVASRRERC